MLHRRQSLRPRQLDVHSRIRLVRSDADIDLEEDSDGNAALSQQQNVTSFQELAEMMVDDQPTKPKRKKNIPIPVNKLVPNYEKEVLPDFHLPTSYIKMSLTFQTSGGSSSSAAASGSAAASSSTSSTQPDKIEVDLEVEDLEWLRAHPRYGELADPRYQLSPDMFARMLDLLEKASALINPGVITLAEADDIFAKHVTLVKSPCHKVSTDVYNYWTAKRLALKRPLLRKYWPQTPLNDTNPHSVFRPREKERYKLRKHRKNDMDGLRKLQQLRHDFDRVRSLLDMVRRREKFKRLLVDFMDETRAQHIHEAMAAAVSSLPPRQPKIPCEDDLKPKKKKKKKHQLQTDTSPTGGASLLASSLPPLAFTDVQKLKVPSFVERLANEQATANEPTTGSFPPAPAELYAAIFQEPPVFRCRWRKGRGGRFIMDRLAHFQASREVQAPPPARPPSNDIGGSSSSARRVYSRQTLEAICTMSDSEDEVVDVVHDEDKTRPTKFMLAV
ncbi:Aste57867_17836 [Aphanomyces stellatus]|uniref:Aste57867_17836 protein n=1 Tax=Aphanomyces stellatus TaxID=120398 RepID=A0A485L8N7_9STRA|nr:hypothetical protein As57867_017775 [Aphanomyces stellatus]VFT94579.1 Aste57867_17836 [Aphanomyces stellatus]